jgi:hypothetical protein
MDYKSYYENQVGSGTPVFQGSRFQKGYGLGSMFKSFFKWVLPVFKTHAVPLLKSSAKALGTEAIRTAANVANDTLSGISIEKSAKNRAKEAIDNISNKAQNAIQEQQQIQEGSGKRKPKKRKKSFIIKKIDKKLIRYIFY